MPHHPNVSRTLLIGLAMLMLAGFIVVLTLGDSLGDVVAVWSILFVLMMFAWRLARGLDGVALAILIIGFAILFRATLVPGWPALSDDMYRYLWDGRVMLEGYNPYACTPADPALSHLRAALQFDNLNSPEFYTVYPPLSQGIFATGVLVSDLLFGGSAHAAAVIIKLILTLFDLAAVVLMLSVLRRLGLGCHHAILYAWNPLPVIEFAGSGHSDSPMVFGLMLVVWAISRPRSHTSAALACTGLAVAILSKALPILLVPMVLARVGWRYTPLLAVMGIFGGWSLLSPELLSNYLDSVRLYFAYFEFNAGLYLALKEVGRWITGVDVSKQLGPALGLVFLAWYLAVLSWYMLRNQHRGTAERASSTMETVRLLRAMLAVLGGYLILSTTVHPWYITWVLPLAVLLPRGTLFAGTSAAWVWLSGAVSWSYFAYVNDPTHLPSWIIAMTWGVFAILLAEGLAAVWLRPIMRHRAAWKARQLAPHVVGETLLDIGSGEGLVAIELARLKSVQPTLADTVDFNRTRLPLVIFDGRTLPFAERSFDTITVLTVLHHCENPERSLDECLRVAARRVIITESVYSTPGGKWLLTLLDRLANRLRSGGVMDEGPLHFATAEMWRARFTQRGLRIVHESWLSRGIHKHILFVIERDAEDTSTKTWTAPRTQESE